MDEKEFVEFAHNIDAFPNIDPCDVTCLVTTQIAAKLVSLQGQESCISRAPSALSFKWVLSPPS